MPAPTLTTPATFTPDTSLASPDVNVKIMLVKANAAVIPAFTPVKRDAAKKVVPATAVTDTVIGLTVPLHGSGWIEQLGLPISATDTLAGVYTEAKVYDTVINWANFPSGDVNTNEKRQAIFDLTEVDVIFNTAGF